MKTTENTPLVTRHIGQDAETDALTFMMQLLMGAMTRMDCERDIEQRWESDTQLLQAPKLAVAIDRLVNELGSERKSIYAADAPDLDFRSKWLVAQDGAPGAIYVDAPPERGVSTNQSTGLNREMHCHDSARAALIIRGEPIFHFMHRQDEQDLRRFVIPMRAGDLIFWPREHPHTFNAMSGFSLLSIMASYVGPDKDGFSYPCPHTDKPIGPLIPVRMGQSN